MRMNRILFIAKKDIRFALRERDTLLWLLIMPLIFFYFIGTVTSGSANPDRIDAIAVKVPDGAGLLAERLISRLQENRLRVVRFDATGRALEPGGNSFDDYSRQLTVPADFTDRVVAGQASTLRFSDSNGKISGDFDKIRVQKATYTLLADFIASMHRSGEFTSASVAALDTLEPAITLEVSPAGRRQKIPSGFEQSVPGIMVMFTMLVLLTSGASQLFVDREQGHLRRLAAAPILRREIVLGKWLGKLFLALIQINFAMLAGSLLFGVSWGPNLPMVLLVLAVWAGFCASAAIVMSNLARTQGQIVAIGVLLSNLLAALSGCWWPIEITPQWMQQLQHFLPPGWTMNALHQFVNFQAEPAVALPSLAALTGGALLLGIVGSRSLKYD